MEAEEIFDRVKVIGEDSGFPRENVTEALGKIPEDVCDWVLDNVWFLWPDNVNGAAYYLRLNIPNDGWCELKIAYIAPHIFDAPTSEQTRVIAHEVAHHWLRHTGPANGSREYDRRENEVEELLMSWGITVP